MPVNSSETTKKDPKKKEPVTTDKNPEKPVKSAKPEKPVKPVKSEKPAKPEKPVKSEKPAKSDKPAKSEKPVKSEKKVSAEKKKSNPDEELNNGSDLEKGSGSEGEVDAKKKNREPYYQYKSDDFPRIMQMFDDYVKTGIELRRAMRQVIEMNKRQEKELEKYKEKKHAIQESAKNRKKTFYYPSDELSAFLGIEKNKPVTREDTVRQIHVYLNDNKLKGIDINGSGKPRMDYIRMDPKLHTLFPQYDISSSTDQGGEYFQNKSIFKYLSDNHHLLSISASTPTADTM